MDEPTAGGFRVGDQEYQPAPQANTCGPSCSGEARWQGLDGQGRGGSAVQGDAETWTPREGLRRSRPAATDPAFIYALTDPRTNEVRYIGRTSLPLRVRLGSHLAHRDSLAPENPTRRWLESLDEAGVVPGIVQLAATTYGESAALERQVIADHRAQGHRLTNVLQGSGVRPPRPKRSTPPRPVTIPQTGEYITLEDAAKIAGYSGAGNLRTAAASGRLQTILINPHCRLTTEEWLRTYLASVDESRRGWERGKPRRRKEQP